MTDSPFEYRTAHGMLDSIVRGERRDDSVRAVRRYFERPTARNGQIRFTGRRFKRFEGGGDRPRAPECSAVVPV